MKPLLKIALVLIAFFASTFLIVKATGILTPAKIEYWFMVAKDISPIYVAAIVITILFLDLLIAVPTLTVTILAGYFLGHTQGALAAFIGMFFSAVVGYALSSWFGPRLLTRVLKSQEKRAEINQAFYQYGFIMVLLARAVPILPEVTACLAGLTRMRFPLFLAAWSISTIPYVLIATYAGSISTLDNPKPAIFTAIGLTAALWLAWLIFQTKKKREAI